MTREEIICKVDAILEYQKIEGLNTGIDDLTTSYLPTEITTEGPPMMKYKLVSRTNSILFCQRLGEKGFENCEINFDIIKNIYTPDV